MSTESIKKACQIKVAKYDASRRMVYGWSVISKVGGMDYYDTHGDHIESNTLEVAAEVFMKGARVAKCQHEGDAIGEVVFGFPLTADIKKALNIASVNDGMVIGMKITDDATHEKFRSGELTGFSIGGTAEPEEV